MKPIFPNALPGYFNALRRLFRPAKPEQAPRPAGRLWRVSITIYWHNHKSYMAYVDWSRDDLQEGRVHHVLVFDPDQVDAARRAIEFLVTDLGIQFPDDFYFLPVCTPLSAHETLEVAHAGLGSDGPWLPA